MNDKTTSTTFQGVNYSAGFDLTLSSFYEYDDIYYTLLPPPVRNVPEYIANKVTEIDFKINVIGRAMAENQKGEEYSDD